MGCVIQAFLLIEKQERGRSVSGWDRSPSPYHPPLTSSIGSKNGSAAGGYTFTDTRSNLVDKGAQGLRIGRTSEHKGPKTEVGSQMLQHLDPVIHWANNRAIGIACGTRHGRTQSARHNIDPPNSRERAESLECCTIDDSTQLRGGPWRHIAHDRADPAIRGPPNEFEQTRTIPAYP